MTRTSIVLTRGDPIAATPSPIAQAAIQAIQAGETHYTHPLGIKALRETIAQILRAELSLTYQPQHNIIVTAGSAPAIFTALTALTTPSDTVLLPEPGWPPYATMVNTLNRHTRTYPIPWAGRFLSPEAWIDALQACITPNTRLMIVNSPHNPTGMILTAPYLRVLADVCALYPRLLVLSDEAYYQLTFDDVAYTSPVTLPELRERIVITRTFSKAYAMAGWRVGYLVAPDSLVGPIRDLHLAMNSYASSISQHAALWALAHGDTVVEDFRARYQANRDYLIPALNQIPGFHCLPPQGTFYLFPSIANFGLSSQKFTAALAAAEHVYVYPGLHYGPSAAHHIRICFAVARHTLETFTERLCRFITSLA